MGLLNGKVAIVTGSNQGFGFEIAKEFLRQGANVTLGARDVRRLNEARDRLAKEFAGSRIVSFKMDVTQAQDVENVVTETLSGFGKVDILVNNAGIYGPKGPIEETSFEEWKAAININLFGSVAFARAVIPYFKKQRSGKIIQLSGGGATKPMPNLSSYATAKAGIVRFCETISEELKEYNVDVNCIAPGALNTRLLDEIIEAGPHKVGEKFYASSLKQQKEGGAPMARGVALCTFLASEASNGITGRLISAIWDRWEELPSVKNALNESDVYTLRRIVAKDRGYDWDR